MKYPKKIFNTVYVATLMLIVVLLLSIQTVKDLIVTFIKSNYKKAPKDKQNKEANQKYIIKQNS